MLHRFLILSLCFTAIRASGEFTVVSAPKSISFEGNEPLDSDFVGDVVAAAIGNDIGADVQWSGLYVNDPFGVAKRAAVILVEGVDHINLESASKTYKVNGGSSAASLRTLISGLKDRSEAVCDLDFNDIEEAQKTYLAFLGDAPVRSIQESQNFNPKLHLADKEFLKSIDLANAVADNIKTMKNFQLLLVRLNLQGVIEAHQANNAAVNDAKHYVDILVSKLNTAIQQLTQNEALVVVVTNKAGNERTKRQAVTQAINLNLAEVYNEDYPVIFNIILWFMVVFGLSLLAISYAIGSMDPGRDSIIYRMTSTRMKKDN